jgi:TPR repeat protein
MAGTVAAVGASPRPRLQKMLLAAAALTFVFAVAWLIAPWVSNRVSMARTSSQVTASPTAAKPVSLPAEVNDLAGLRKLAEQGDPAAQFALGARYATGEEVQQDYSEAVRWFARAADQGHILAQATLGAYYWAGRGVPPDLTKAYFWSALAQAGGDQASKYRVAVLTSRMSRSEILAAQQQANDWLHNHQTAGNASASQ